jgi:hypothetical protein
MLIYNKRIWKTEVFTAQGNQFGTYYFDNLVDAFESVRQTWVRCPSEILETPMAEEFHYLWCYYSDLSRVAVTIQPIDLTIHDTPIHF